MNNTKVLAELEFNDIINGSAARTQTGADLLNKYKTYLMTKYFLHLRIKYFQFFL